MPIVNVTVKAKRYQQISLFALQTQLKVLAYTEGQRRSHQSPASFQEYDIVLATYFTVYWDSPLRLDKVLFK